MSDWSDLNLPSFQTRGYGYSIDASLSRTGFACEHPNQSRINRANRKTFSVEVLLTPEQLTTAETFLNTHAGWFTADLMTGHPAAPAYSDHSVRLTAPYQVSAVGMASYRLKMELESEVD